MPQNTESEPAKPVLAEAGRAVEVTGGPGTPGLPGHPTVPHPGFAVVIR
ncbi:hypothetical protein ACF05L_06110 [Streptomyces bobili]